MKATLDRLSAVRIAGLPASVVERLRAPRAAQAERALCDAEARADEARTHAIEVLFDVVRGCDDTAVRRAAIEAKRRLFHGKTIAGDEIAWPEAARAAIARVRDAEREIARATIAFEDAFAGEQRSVSRALREVLRDERLLSAIRLTSKDHFETARRLAALPDDARLGAAEQIREATLARYVLRAATRTTPFASFASVALVDTDSPRDAGPSRARRFAQANVGAVMQLVRGAMTPEARARLPLRVTPLCKREGTSVVFARDAWMSVDGGAAIARICDRASGLSTDEAARALATPKNGEAVWRAAIERLVEVGLLEIVWPAPATTPSGLAELASRIEALGDPALAARLRACGDALARFASSSAHEERERSVRVVAESVGVDAGGRSVVFEDVLIEGLDARALVGDRAALERDLAPVLALARASGCDAAHRAMIDAFVGRFGEGGVCDDVPGFVVDVLRDEAIAARLRAPSPIAWLDSPLARALEEDAPSVSIDRAIFDALPATVGPGSLATFVQVTDRNVILNGVQSGRSKYLSRYLGAATAKTDAALADIRAELERARPLPIDLVASLGQNFELRPQLTRARLESPIEATSGATEIRLRDLRLTFDADRGALRLACGDLEVEPIHLGFLRDPMLPAPLLALRALSPRLRDETLVERMDLYATLDQRDIERTGSPRPHRPRIEVGRLVIERERWAIALREIPVKRAKQTYASFFREVARWRRSRGLPARGFARATSRATFGADLAQSRILVDWESPLTLAGLARFAAQREGEDGWLMFTELLPAPEDALLDVDGERRVAEVMLQWRWGERP